MHHLYLVCIFFGMPSLHLFTFLMFFKSCFGSGSCFEHSGAQLNMDQSDSINNRTVKFVVSCCVVFKQVEVSTILASVESTGSWLHAGTCPVFVR